tara:strand:- start:306 stop:509 length:204 start_codon:yes stop_codon:yes gene_type:complete
MAEEARKLIRQKAVTEITGLARSSIYDAIRHTGFPKPVKLTERTVAWVESDVRAWVDERIAASRTDA